MKLVEFTVYNVGSLVSVNPEAVSQVGMMKDGHAIIHRIDGVSVETSETYEEVCKALVE
jgi:predicted transcriptional regulator